MTIASNLNPNPEPPAAPPEPSSDAVVDNRSAASNWALTPLARVLNERERHLLKSVMPSMYQPVCVQINGIDNDSALDLITGGVSFYVTENPDADVETGAPVCARPEALPFAARSVDLVILNHVLEFTDKPHEILREVEQIMAPGGHIVLLGFNPLSLWGLRRLMYRITRRHKSRPWRGNWLRLSRIRDWVRLLGLESTGGRIGVYGLPIQSDRLLQRFEFLDRAGSRWWPGFGAVYVVVVMKREMSATPLKHGFRRNRQLRPGLVTPMSRRNESSSKQS